MATRSVQILRKNINKLRNALASLARSLLRFAPLLATDVASSNQASKTDRRPPRLSAKGHASLVLQGRYMGYMRQLKPK
ncbi:MAG: hypothetical protein L0191_00070, partial [Acidobacteria bacterium]|nr:hypothetical protein [Acidobacteriota bacterium]